VLTRETFAAKMTSNKKKHVNEDEAMQESDEDVSGEEESDEEEQIAPGDEVSVGESHFTTSCNSEVSNQFRKFKLILRDEIRLTATSTVFNSCCVSSS
jgi:hypothetical protein